MNPEWQELADLLYQEGGKEVMPPTQLPAGRDALIAFLVHHELRVDELCDLWSLTGEWPLMLPVEWWLIQFRLWHGWKLAVRLARSTARGRTLPTVERREALRWLIADSWTRFDTEALADVPAASASPRIVPPDWGRRDG